MRPLVATVAALALALGACATIPRGGDRESAKLLARLGRCGVDTRAGKLAYDPAESLVTLLAAPALTPAQTRCAARVMLDRGLDLRSADLAFAARYAEAWERENALVGPRMARLWVRKNVKGQVPPFAPNSETLTAYVSRLERMCQAPPGSVAATTTASAVRVPWLAGAANDQVSCVYLAALASNLAAHGIRVE